MLVDPWTRTVSPQLLENGLNDNRWTSRQSERADLEAKVPKCLSRAPSADFLGVLEGVFSISQLLLAICNGRLFDMTLLLAYIRRLYPSLMLV